MRAIACIRYSSWVCTIACEVAKFRYDTLATHIDVLRIFATLPCHEIWADIEAEACRTGVTTRELRVTFSDYRLRLGNAQANLALHSTCAIIHIDGFILATRLHSALAIGIISVVAPNTFSKLSVSSIIILT